MSRILGVDFGGVLVDTSTPPENFLEVPPITGAFEALHRLKEKRFGDQIYVVSHASSPELERMALDWLDHHNFFTRTGIKQENLRFCRELKDKADICADLRVTHFIDDRMEVLSKLLTVGTRYLFRADVDEMVRHISFLSYVLVETWEQILRRELS